MKYDVTTGDVAAVKTGLCTPNSIELSSDEKRAFITHSMRYKIGIYDVDTWELLKYTHITGECLLLTTICTININDKL